MTDRIIPQTRFCWHGATPENMLVITLKLLIEDVMTWWSNILVQTVLVATSWPITNTCPTFVITWCSNTLVQTVLAATSWPITNACLTFVITWCSNSLVQTAGGHIMTRQVTNTCPDPCDYSQPRCYDAKLTSLFVQTVLAAPSWQVTNTCPDPCDYRQPRCYDTKLTSLFV